jgi:signal transduction histidine kinase
VAPAVLVGVIAVGGSLASGSHQPSARPLDAVSILLLVGGAGALLARRRWPIATLVTTVVLLVGYLSAGYPYGPVVLPFLAAVINAVLAGHRRVVWLIAAAGYAGLIGAVHIREGWPGWWAVTGIAAWLLVVLTLAELARARVERHQRARREQREAARQRATEERLRIARELHDVLAHHVSLINVQAGSALHVLDRNPEIARDALAAIKASSKEVLVELRGLLRTLRDSAEDAFVAGPDPAPRTPVAGLARVDELAERVRSAGVDVTVHREGTVRPLPATVDAAAFRIVQEALTNVRRHSRATGASVLIGYGPDRLTVQVDDDGPSVTAAPEPATGTELASDTGIAGMRERAAALGGRFSADSRPGGGYRVRAEFPVEARGGST